jgi:GT2 family glycosyltransferase
MNPSHLYPAADRATKPVADFQPAREMCVPVIDVSIIVVSYNTRELTVACLESVYAQTKAPFELIVLDNASSDGSADAIAARFPQATLIRSQQNLGFAGANNAAARKATGRYLLLLNPDTLVLDSAIDKLLAFAHHHPQAGIWGGRTVFTDGKLNPTYCWKRQTLWSTVCCASGLNSVLRGNRLFDPEALGAWNHSNHREVDIVSGCFLLITRALWERLRGFDPAFFMYGEEADLCLRAHALGARPRITTDATIVHYGGASEKVRSDKLVKLIKAKTLLIRRHWPPALSRVGIAMLTVWPLSRALAWNAISRVSPSHGALDNAASWKAVWNRRREWLDQPSQPPRPPRPSHPTQPMQTTGNLSHA